MEWTLLTAALAFTTFLSAIAFAFYSKRKVEERLADRSARKSTLAADQKSNAKPADV